MKVGDTVRVIDPEHLLVAFAAKIRDRDALVLRVGPIGPHELFKGRAEVEFQLRNGRGKKFKEWMWIGDLEVLEVGA